MYGSSNSSYPYPPSNVGLSITVPTLLNALTELKLKSLMDSDASEF